MGHNQKKNSKNIKIFYRILPQVDTNWEYLRVLDDMKTLYIRCLQDLECGNENCIPSYWTFETDGIFHNNSQQEIYDVVVSDTLEGYAI